MLTLVSEHYLQLTHRPIPLCCVSTLRQPPSWPLPAALMPRSLHPFVHGSCKFFFFNHFAFAHSGFIVPSCRICSLVPCPLSHAASVLMPRPFSCHVRSPMLLLHPTHAASTPLPLAYPGCIDVPTYVRCVRCLSPHRCPSTARCALCALCPHPLLHPCLALCMRL